MMYSNTPVVSIVLPTYNGAKHIKESIESCLSQSFKGFELIIVDDCSTDNTAEIIQPFIKKDSRVKYIRNEKNKKLPLSLNAGFENATGKYFTWTSDDNYYAATAIEELVNLLENNNNIGLVYSNYTTIDDNGDITGVKIFGDVNQNMVSWKGCGACFLYKRELHYQLNGYDASAFLIEDYDFFIRALSKVKFFYLDRTDLYYYRLHSTSLTSLYGFYNFDLQKIVIERELSNLLAIASEKEKALWFRKFAVFYGVSKNNNLRMQFYIRKLSHVSPGQAALTTAYIIFQKIRYVFEIGFGAAIASIKGFILKK